MIREWRMSQFKSVGQGQNLELRPLSVLAGANSSGKSSVIQSMLLLSQTLMSKVFRRHLVFNGELVKLGTFDDVLHEGAQGDSIGLGFTLESGLTSARLSASYGPRNLSSGYGHRGQAARATISTDITFGPSTEASTQRGSKSGQTSSGCAQRNIRSPY